METYPSILPDCQRGYAVTPVQNVVTTRFVGGNAFDREIAKATNDQFQCKWIYTDYQYRMWRYFHREKIANGTHWFLGNYHDGLHVTGAVIKVRKYSAKQVDNAHLFEVTATVEVQNNVEPNAVGIQWAIDLGVDESGSLIGAIHDMATNNNLAE